MDSKLKKNQSTYSITFIHTYEDFEVVTAVLKLRSVNTIQADQQGDRKGKAMCFSAVETTL